MFSIRCVYPPGFYGTRVMQQASVFFEPPSGTVQYVGSVLDDSHFTGGGGILKLEEDEWLVQDDIVTTWDVQN